MRNLLDANYRTYGVLVMELNTDTLFDSMRSVIWMTDATVWLGDAESPSPSCPPGAAWTARPWSGTENIWWPCCWRLPMDSRSSGAICAGSCALGKRWSEWNIW